VKAKGHLVINPVVAQICIIFVSRYRTAYSNRFLIMSPPTSLLTYLQNWRQVLLNGVYGWSVVISTVVVKQTNSNWGMFSMFIIIEALQDYFTHELLPYNLSSEVALHFSVT